MADVVNPETGEVLIEANEELKAADIAEIIDAGISEFSVFDPERDDVGVVLSQTIKKDNIKTTNEALIEIYRKLPSRRPSHLGNGHPSVPRHVL